MTSVFANTKCGTLGTLDKSSSKLKLELFRIFCLKTSKTAMAFTASLFSSTEKFRYYEKYIVVILI